MEHKVKEPMGHLLTHSPPVFEQGEPGEGACNYDMLIIGRCVVFPSDLLDPPQQPTCIGSFGPRFPGNTHAPGGLDRTLWIAPKVWENGRLSKFVSDRNTLVYRWRMSPRNLDSGYVALRWESVWRQRRADIVANSSDP